MNNTDLYYQFSPGQFEDMCEWWPNDGLSNLLAYDPRNGGIYYAAQNSAFADWLDEHLTDLVDNGIENVEAIAFSPNSGEGAGDG